MPKRWERDALMVADRDERNRKLREEYWNYWGWMMNRQEKRMKGRGFWRLISRFDRYLDNCPLQRAYDREDHPEYNHHEGPNWALKRRR